MDQKIVKAGIVGIGLVSTPHLKGYLNHPNAEVTAVCDLERQRAQKFADRFGISQVYTSFEEMLSNAGINTVDIATPTFLHARMTLQAARAGKHIHCEKPFCRSIQEGREAVEAVHQSGQKLLVGETYVFISSHMKARELIESGEIGHPLQIRQRHGDWLERERPLVDTGPKDRSWRLDPQKSGGGDYPWIYDHAVHFFSTAEYFLPGQKISEIYALKGTSRGVEKKSGAAHDPYSTANVDIPIITWKFEDTDCQGVWMRAERLNGKFDHMRGFSSTIIGDKGAIEVLGEGGHNLLWNGNQQHLILHRKGKETLCFRFDEGGDDVWQSDISYYSCGHIHQVHELIESVCQNRTPRYSGEDGIHSVECTLATIISARENRPIKINEVPGDFTAY